MNTINLTFRRATHKDVSHIVQLLANDPLGSQRETPEEPLPQSYYTAFAEIDADKNNYLVVAEHENKLVATLQLTFIPYLSYRGSKRAQIENVRVDEAYRSRGVGRLLMQWAIDKAREAGCYMVQLTTDKNRQPKAIGFYEKLDFILSHDGMKC